MNPPDMAEKYTIVKEFLVICKKDYYFSSDHIAPRYYKGKTYLGWQEKLSAPTDMHFLVKTDRGNSIWIKDKKFHEYFTIFC